MNYEAHLSTLFENKEIEVEFFKALMRQLNSITFNGSKKISGITEMGGATIIKFQATKEREKESYCQSLSKVSKVTLG